MNTKKKNKLIPAISLVGLLLALAISVVLLRPASLSHAQASRQSYDSNDSYFEVYNRGGYSMDDIRQMFGTSQGYEYMRVHTPFDGVSTYLIPYEAEYESLIQPRNTYTYSILRGRNRNPANSIVVVLLADGFMANEMGNSIAPTLFPGTFLYHAYRATNTMLGTHPFNLFSDVFMVYAIHTISTDSGITVNYGNNQVTRDTYFRAYAPESGRVRMPSSRRTQARRLANQLTNNNADMIQVIANTTLFGGTAFMRDWHLTNPNPNVALTTLHGVGGGWHRTVLHEFGHSFGSFADVSAGTPARPITGRETPNMTRASNTNNNVRWSHWIGRGNNQVRGIGFNNNANVTRPTIGVFREGANAPANWAVTNPRNCIMSPTEQNRAFCAVSSSELTRRMAGVAGQHFYGKLPNGNIPNRPHFTLPSNVHHSLHRILPYAFNGNTTLQSVTINDDFVTIGDYAFLGATNLRAMHFNTIIAPVINNTTFAGLNPSLIRVYIPYGRYQAFRNAGWTHFNLVDPSNILEFTRIGNTNNAEVRRNPVAGHPSHISIPYTAVVNGETLNVTAIAAYGFMGFFGETVSIPSSVRYIGNNAFLSSVPYLRTPVYDVVYIDNWAVGVRGGQGRTGHVTVRNGTVGIAEGTFSGTRLSEVTIPASVVEIGIRAFYRAPYLHRVNFAANSNLQRIGEGAFAKTDLRHITIPGSVRNIGAWAFEDTANLQSVNFTFGMYLRIGRSAFRNSGLRSIIVPRHTRHIEDTVFENALNLNSVEFESGSYVWNIGWGAFRNTPNLTSLQIPPRIQRIGHGAFWGANGLASVTIPHSVQVIEANAFEGATNLRTVIFESGSNLSYIGRSAFADSGVETIHFPSRLGIIAPRAFENTNLQTITFPPDANIHYIGADTFRNVTSLSSIRIPRSVTHIGSDAFAGWTSNQRIYVVGRSSAHSNWSHYWDNGSAAQVIWNAA